MQRGMMRVRVGKDRRGEHGASLVEFAILAPLLIILIFGIIDFSWIFAQNLGVRSGAREAARIAAVNFGDGEAIADEVCVRTDFISNVELLIQSDQTLVPPTDEYNPGDEVTTTITSHIDTLTGLFDSFFPSPFTLSSSVSIRIEQVPPAWDDDVGKTVPGSC
jgi:hypothetical protein